MRSTKSPSWSERLLGVGARSAPPHVFALTPDLLRYCAFERTGAGARLVAEHALPLEPGLLGSGPLSGAAKEPGELEAVIRELVAQIGDEVSRASLLVPDRWLRLVFAEITDLPESATARREALRFKLRQLVPFRVEDLRVRALEIQPLPEQDEPRRLALAVASEALLASLETAFAASGVRIGSITNGSLALASRLETSGLNMLVSVEELGYSLLVGRDGEPLLYRYKELRDGSGGAVLEQTIQRELLLTKSFLEERLEAADLARVYVAAPDPELWCGWIGAALGQPCERVDAELLGLQSVGRADDGGVEGFALGALMGAALQEVA